jgi:hypothetical protein
LWNDTIKLGLAADPMMRGHLVEEMDAALDVLWEFLLARAYILRAMWTYFDHLREEYPSAVYPACVA